MNADFDTSALLPILVDEPGSSLATRLWDDAGRVVASALVYPEGRAALAQAFRLRRITGAGFDRVKRDFETLYDQLDLVATDESLLRRAGTLAEQYGLRAYDAVHLAAAERVADAELVFVAGDHALVAAAAALGLAVADTSAQ